MTESDEKRCDVWHSGEQCVLSRGHLGCHEIPDRLALAEKDRDRLAARVAELEGELARAQQGEADQHFDCLVLAEQLSSLDSLHRAEQHGTLRATPDATTRSTVQRERRIFGAPSCTASSRHW